MRVKRFVGQNVAETIGKVKKELGSEAVILQTRQFREGGFLGLFSKLKVEITAAIEDSPVVIKKAVQPARTPNKDLSNVPVDLSLRSEKVPIAANRLPEKDSLLLQQEIQDMKKMLEKMNKHMEGLGGEKVIWPVPLQVWSEVLRERGLNENLINRILRQIQQTLCEQEWYDQVKVRYRLEEIICQLCINTSTIQPGHDKPRIVALIGPTGVGKTTTIGKLAAGFSIVDKRKVALITADTYRVAAVEQLKTFGEIIGVSVEVAMTPSGLRNALHKHADKELIFIDTAGRSPHHDLHMSELRAFLDKANPDLTILVMSATTQLSDQLRVFKRFEPFTTHLIFTKLDETASAGSILNLLENTTLPTAYFTNGQNVPDDIEVATPQCLVSYILGKGNLYA
ncbi:MAG: flagellar biosynthesis protein FlhF [Desulfitobacteriaceae bacterium]